MPRVLIYIIGIFFASSIFQACSLSKSIEDHQRIVAKNKIKIENNKDRIPKVELENYIQQTQTPKALGLFYTNLYIHKKFSEKKDNGFNRWMMRVFGDKPVVWDARKTARSETDIRKYLNNIGYFDAHVKSLIHQKNNKVEITYYAIPGKAYRIYSHDYIIQDSTIDESQIQEKSIIKKGDIYNSYVLEEERNRIAELMRDNGFYEFNRAYVSFLVDSSLHQNQIKITTLINAKTKTLNDSTKESFQPFKINEVYIYPNYEQDQSLPEAYDTLVLDLNLDKKAKATGRYHFLYKNKLQTNPRAIAQSVFIETDEYYSNRDLKETYKKLNRFPTYKYVSISYQEQNNHELNTFIHLHKSKKQFYSIETDGTNSSGDLGIRLGLNYGNKSIFKGGEFLNLRFTTAFENRKYSGYEEENYQKFWLFNTMEYGGSLSLYSPSFIVPIRQSRFPKYFKPQTFIRFGYNYQIRPSYERYISSFNFGYEWKQNQKIFHRLSVLDVNLIKVFPSELFQAGLDSINNARYKAQYEDHFIAAINYAFVYNTQQFKEHQSFDFLNIRLEAAGNLTYGLHELFQQPTNEGYHQVFGIRYAQYARAEIDYRHYWALPNKQATVLRFNGGLGLPYGNSIALPFEKGFYGGGANGMRAWAFRDLGPGTYTNDLGPNYDKMGDIKLEANLEYRYPLYNYLKGAVFIDAGNIWLLHSSETFPGGEFKLDRFYEQFALDIGMGFRLDFDIFIFRIDGALKTQDPSKELGQGFVLPKSQIKDIYWSFGIGYPF